HKEDGDSFTIPQNVRIENGRLYVTKVGWVPICRQGGDPWAHGKVKQAVVVKPPNGKWHVSLFWEVPDAELKDNGEAVGLDMGKWNVATTEPERIFMPDVSRLETRLKRHQRKMHRRKRVPLLDADGEARRTRQGKAITVNSRRREKERRIVAKLYRRVAHIRDNWKHHVSCDLASRFGTVCVEDLKIRNMMKSAKGTMEKPGKNVKAKSSLNRGIAESGWGRLRWMLDYKAHRVEKVDPAYTSQRCHQCGHVAEENRREERFKCVSCGYAGNADINAAFNILALGTGAAGQGGAFASVRAGSPGAVLSSDPDDLFIDIQGLLADYCV
ncbi:MAG: transposase, partial [Gammaproteobacteria bacterium]|nr:transposase [Gammaproteobacteria bacterium]MDE0612267.1 transposase [Gammaproteobacteria bacterium]